MYMCGIAGIWHKHGGVTVSEDALVAMRDAIHHRGPDDAGVYIDGSLGLAHRRLSIIDTTSAGHQPMSTPDGRYTIVFNGEIYNYQELRNTYLSAQTFSSQSDTEVLLHLLAAQGYAILPHLRGMFAFAFWDKEEETLLLACDPMGKKPLYYSEINGTLLFASEPKAFIKSNVFTAEINKSCLPAYLLHEYVPAPATALQGVSVLPMGHYGLITKETTSIQSWWKPSFFPKIKISETAALKKLDALMAQSIERRLVSDVPVGIFLSGGLDSTTILWYMQHLKRGDIQSCSVSFSDASFDESSYVDKALESFDTIHHSLRFGVKEFLETISFLADTIDLPLADASLLPTYAVSQLAKQYMTVVLSGDGSDEIFAGYGTFKAGEVAEHLRFVPRGVWNLLSTVTAHLPVSHQYFSWDFKLKSFLRAVNYPLLKRNQIWLGAFKEDEMRRLLVSVPKNLHELLWQYVNALQPDMPKNLVLDAVSYATVCHYLQNDILVKLDRATMLSSLEARTPFLDLDLVEFVTHLPVALKRDKYLLKKLMRGRIADSIIDRPKKGFGIPLGRWFQGPLNAWLHDVLSVERVQRANLFQWPYVAKLIYEHEENRADHRKKLWTIISMQLWFERWSLKVLD